ncbi:ATP-binding protein [Aerococcus urinaeequi]|uniref:ATP-binding protein n=1 Tax=Aerococcus urinaeequi TaxID=51665 RepID=UPI003D6A4599
MSQQNYDKLKYLKLSGMADAYESILANPSYSNLTFDESLNIMIDQEESVHKSIKLNRLLKQASFTVKASVEEIQYDADRKLDKALLMELAARDYILNGRNIIFKGISGAGNTC